MLWVVKHKICQTYGFQISSLSLTIFVAMGIFHCNWTLTCKSNHCWGFPHSSVGKESACNAGNPGSIPGSETSAGDGIGYPLQSSWASPVAQLVKNPPAMWETWVRFLGWEDPLVLQVHRVAESDTTESLSLSLYFHFSCSVVSDSDLIGLYSPGSSVHGIFQGRIVEWVATSFLGYLPDPEIEPCLLHWPAGSLPQSHLGNPQIKNHITN